MRITIYDDDGKPESVTLDAATFVLAMAPVAGGRRVLSSVVGPAAPTIPPPSLPPTPPPAQPANLLPVFGYWNSIGNPALPVADIDFSAVSHIIHWAALPMPDGSLDLNTHQIPTAAPGLISAAHAAGVKVLLGIVSSPSFAGTPQNITGVVANPTLRAKFVTRIMAVVNQYNYDGVDLDWEGSAPDVSKLGPDLRSKLGAGRWLTAAAVVTDYPYWGTVHSPFDRVNVMTYALNETAPAVWHNTALYGPPGDAVWSIELAVRRYLAGGVPASKLGMGLAFYGLFWPSITSPTQPAPNPTEIPYRDIAPLIPQRTRGFDTTARVPFLSGPGLISYEDAASITEKMAFVKSKGLGGVILWNLQMGYSPNTNPKSPLLNAAKLAR